MAVSVDTLRSYARIKPAARRFGIEWCHLMVDSEDPLEMLHEFALSIGLKRAWFQDHATVPHYDLTPSKRHQAVVAGAQELDGLEQARRCYRGKDNGRRRKDS